MLHAAFRALAVTLALGTAPAWAGGRVHHVPSEYATIQAAVLAAAPGDTVLVADGIYTGAGNRDIDMQGKDLVVRSANGPAACIIDCQADAADPHRGFSFSSGETRAARVQGFTIRNGDTPDGAISDTFNGGAIQIVGSSPTISECVFEDNDCGCWGGAVYCAGVASPLIERCMFRNNSAGDDGGGLFCWSGASPVVLGSVFIGNSAPAWGGAITNFGWNTEALQLIHVTILDNSAGSASAVATWGPTTIENSIIWGNDTVGGPQVAGGGPLTVTYSNVQGGFAGIGNIDAAPRFAKDGLHLAHGSPCIDAGSAGLPATPFDIDGQPRLVGPRVDMGADEHMGFAAQR